MLRLQIKGALRSDTGRRASKAARREGLVPCELYGAKENIHFSVSPKSLKDLVYTPDFHVAEVDIDGKVYNCIMKDIQFHPVSEEILHVDFLKLEEGRKVKVEVPVRFSGMAPGVKAGGKLTQKVHRVSIKATPENLIEQVTLDISKLRLGQSVRVRDIKVGGEIEVLNHPSIPLASVTIPRALKSAGSAAELEEEEEIEEVTEGQEAAAE
ncbi:MAG: 50S ribosomal protein L25 [Saprospiraceae bacterium]|nr:50S ribosomal protein L25 [Saprospiraceae bacterium]